MVEGTLIAPCFGIKVNGRLLKKSPVLNNTPSRYEFATELVDGKFVFESDPKKFQPYHNQPVFVSDDEMIWYKRYATGNGYKCFCNECSSYTSHDISEWTYCKPDYDAESIVNWILNTGTAPPEKDGFNVWVQTENKEQHCPEFHDQTDWNWSLNNSNNITHYAYIRKVL